MKKDPNLTYNGSILLEGVRYDYYEIEKIEWNLQTNLFSVWVNYINQSESKKRSIAHPLKVGGDVLINEVIETIHTIHKKYKL